MTETEQPKALNLANQLKQAREQRKLALEDIAAKLNLSEEKLQALESQDLQLGELNNFERGYLRNYASYLEVDISSYEKEFPEGSHVSAQLKSMERFSYEMPTPKAPSQWFKRLYYGVIIILVIGLLILFANSFTASDLNQLWQ